MLLIDREWRQLAPLLGGLDGVDQLALELSAVTGFDLHCPLLDLPRLFGTRLDSIPAATPYLAADPARRAAWRSWLADAHPPDGTLRIGLVWAGNPHFARDRLRSPGLAPLLPLLALPGTRWYGLQVGAGRGDLEDRRMPDRFTDLGRDLRDFADTAAVMSELDPGDQLLHRGGAPRRRARPADLGDAAGGAGLALAARARRLAVVSDRSAVPPSGDRATGAAWRDGWPTRWPARIGGSPVDAYPVDLD
ncbi:MAG: hypothetical protein WDO24_17230 [Pseudomonadota bacterium]